MCLSTCAQDLYFALGRQDGSFGSPSNSSFWEQLRCSHQSVRVQVPRVLGSTCVTGLSVLGMPTENHTATVGHKPTRIQLPLCERDVNSALATRCHLNVPNNFTFSVYTLNACRSIRLPIKHSSRTSTSASDMKTLELQQEHANNCASAHRFHDNER